MSAYLEDNDEALDWASLPEPLEMPTAELLRDYQNINVLAPLVRCSKLPFRHLVSLYETHITNTPMILAQEFSRSQMARVSDFSTSQSERGVFWVEPKRPGGSSFMEGDQDQERRDGAADATGYNDLNDTRPRRDSGPEHAGPSAPTLQSRPAVNNGYIGEGRGHNDTNDLPIRLPPTLKPPTKHSQLVRGRLVAQFASPNPESLADAAELISPYVDSIDLNCGCPQKWAYHEGIGCALLRKPELVRDMVRCVKGRMGWDFGMSVKIRVDPDLKLTEKLVRHAVEAGASHITIHGRTRHQASTEPVNLEALKFAVECTKGEVACVGNGDIWEYEDVDRMRQVTGCTGVMGARGLLANPALFAGYRKTPQHAVEQFVNLSADYGLLFPLFHHHVSYMLESHFLRPERIYFNTLPSAVGVVDYLSTRGLNFRSARADPIWDARRGRAVAI